MFILSVDLTNLVVIILGKYFEDKNYFEDICSNKNNATFINISPYSFITFISCTFKLMLALFGCLPKM